MTLEERRAAQFNHLLSALGEDGTAALEVQNAIDQVGIEDEVQRAEVMDAVIDSIERGQRWATGARSVEVRTCPVCEGKKRSRSALGRCKACKGTGRVQVRCRECAETPAMKRMQTTCVPCRSTGQLDPVDDREKILKQHREWWQRVTTMPKAMPKREWSIQHIIDGCRPPATDGSHEILMAQHGRAAMFDGPDGGPGTISDIYKDRGSWFVRLGIDPSSYPASQVYLMEAAGRPSQDEVYESMKAEPAVRFTTRCRWERRGSCWYAKMRGYNVLAKQYAADEWRACVEGEAKDFDGKTLELAEEGLFAALRERDMANAIVLAAPEAAQAMPVAIAVALFEAQTYIRKVPKSSENHGDGYEYTSAEVIVEEARTALHQAGLAVMPKNWRRVSTNAIAPGHDELEVTFRVIHKNGVTYDCDPVRMPIVLDAGVDRRAPDKALATALTYCESQWLRVTLQIPRIGRSEDADARTDQGHGRRGRGKQAAGGDTPLSTELNDVVIALHEAIDNAKSNRALNGAAQRLEQVREKLPAKVVERIQEKLTAKQLAMPNEAALTAAKPEGSGT